MQAYKYAAAFLAGAVLCVLFIGYVANMRIEYTAKDCELMGEFRYKDTVYTCTRTENRHDTH